MPDKRIEEHPILETSVSQKIKFYWQNQPFLANAGEVISSALIANGINIFGYHPKDHSPLGLFCANGQCSQCMVLVHGKPVKACMTRVKNDMSIMPATGLPDITGLSPANGFNLKKTHQNELQVQVLIIGGGPAGLSAAIELGQLGADTLLVDDKSQLGGKLVLQTHRFFGSTEAVYAGTRGIDITSKLESQLEDLKTLKVWTDTTAVAIYEDQTVGLWQVEEEKYVLVKPEILLVASGARERSLPFKGNTLPGIFGAGAFQTLVNRDLIRPADNLLIIGGGNVGLIAGYHALQAGINVVGLVEALPECGGYQVHEDKLARFNIPIHTSHTILEARGSDHVSSAVIAEVDQNFQPIPGSEKEIVCDCILIAVGLDPVDEFRQKALEVGLPVFAAGDAQEIAEASSAMYSGKIKGIEIARRLGINVTDVPESWHDFERILKSHPGEVLGLEPPTNQNDVFPVMHCRQEIPCDPCASVCPHGLIRLETANIRSLPSYTAFDDKNCIACERCVAICPGLAITLVDFRKNTDFALVSIPIEFAKKYIRKNELVPVTDIDGHVLGEYPVVQIRELKQFSHTLLVKVQVPAHIATKVSGVQLAAGWTQTQQSTDHFLEKTPQETIVCRCEHITSDAIRSLVRSGVRDINQIKSATKATMGSCGGKTCISLIKKIFHEEGVPIEKVTEPTLRPVFVEVPLSILAKHNQEES